MFPSAALSGSLGARAPEQAEVAAGGGQDGIDAVAFVALEVVAAVLWTADHRLHSGSATHFPADGVGDTSDLAGDLEPVRMVVTAIALVAVDAHTATPVTFSAVDDDRTEPTAIIRIAVQHELPARGSDDRRGDRDLATELVGSPCLPGANAFQFAGVQRIDLRTGQTLLLMAAARSARSSSGQAVGASGSAKSGLPRKNTGNTASPPTNHTVARRPVCAYG
jgi:hypothetical protein